MSSYQAGAPARPFVLAGTKRVYERSRPFDVRHVALDLALDFVAKAVRGVAALSIARVDPAAKTIALDAVGFEIEAVEVELPGEGPKAAPHVYDGLSLEVTIPDAAAEATVRVRYRAVPRRGLYFLEPDEHVQHRPRQAWTQCQDEDARHFFPCHDKPHVKFTLELVARVPAGMTVIANGAIEGDDAERATGVHRFRMGDPLPSYLVTLVVGEFSRLDAVAGDVPLAYYVPKGREEDGKRTFKRTPEMVLRFGQLTGVPYPWNKYDQVVVSDFIFGGMENTTATTMYEHILVDERASLDITSDDLVAHELAHHWFGDYVTCRDWSHAWLNEGFATFMEHIDREGAHGRDEYDYSLHGDLEAYLGEARGRYRRPIVCQDYEAPIDVFDRHLYEKGACVLHLARTELGDALFWKGVSTYLRRHARGVVETRDLARALEDVSGRSLEQFFDQWVYRAGHADVAVTLAYDGGALTVTVKQALPAAPPGGEAPAPYAFDLVVDVALPGETEPRREVRRVDQATHTFVLPMAERPRHVVVDPDLRVLGEARVDAPADMLRAQLREAKTARGRWLACGPLSKLDDPPTTKALAEALADEREFWGVRAEAAAALGSLRSEAAFDALVARIGTTHPKVRRAVVRALGAWRTAKAAKALEPVALRDASYLVEAEAARSLGATRQPSALDTLVEVIDRPSWADVIRVGAIDGLAALRDERAVPHVSARTRYGVSTRGRRAAILALPKLATDRRTRELLEDLLDSSDPYLRVDVVRALAELGDPKARGALQQRLDRDLDGRVRRRIREVLRDLAGPGRKDTAQLRDELEALRAEHADLRARLGKLEAMTTAPKAGEPAVGTARAAKAPRKGASKAAAKKASRSKRRG
jgi:aminopeptidase N